MFSSFFLGWNPIFNSALEGVKDLINSKNQDDLILEQNLQ